MFENFLRISTKMSMLFCTNGELGCFSYLSEIIEQYYDKKLDEGQCVLLDRTTRPPRLLICYSSNDGPAHVRVVLQLAAFLQKHMGTQVSVSRLNQTKHTVIYFKVMKC